MSLETLRNSFDDLQARACENGVQVELMITGRESLKLGYQKRQLDKYEAAQTQKADFRVLKGANCGYASTENLSPEGLKRAFDEALANSKIINKQGPELELAGPQKIQKLESSVAYAEAPVHQLMDLTRELEERALDQDSRVNSVPYSGLVQSEGWVCLLNSKGVDVEFRQGSFHGYSYPLAIEGEKRKCDGDFTFSRNFQGLDVEGAVDRAVQKVLKLLKAQPLKTGKYPVVLSRHVVGDFMSMLMDSLSAKSLEKGNSFLSGKLGQKVGSSHFSLKDDPFSERGVGSRPFDAEGSASQITSLFQQGQFQSFLTNLEYAKKMNLPHTASAARAPGSVLGIGVSNLVVEKGTASFDSLLKMAPELIYLTNIDGGLHAGFNDSTGDFSLPAQGFWVRHGEIQNAVDQFVVSGNILDLIARVEAAGDTDNPVGSGVQAPDLFVSELSFAGKA